MNKSTLPGMVTSTRGSSSMLECERVQNTNLEPGDMSSNPTRRLQVSRGNSGPTGYYAARELQVCLLKTEGDDLEIPEAGCSPERPLVVRESAQQPDSLEVGHGRRRPFLRYLLALNT